MANGTRAFRRTLLAGIVLLLAACSTPGGGSGGPAVTAPGATVGPSLDANATTCKLLSQAEAETAFGQTFKTPVGSQTDTVASCQWFNSNGFGLQIDVNTAPTFDADYEKDKASFGTGAKDLPGVGDKAFEFFQGRRQIDFVKGKAFVTLYSASRIEPDGFRALAKVVADRVQ